MELGFARVHPAGFIATGGGAGLHTRGRVCSPTLVGANDVEVDNMTMFMAPGVESVDVLVIGGGPAGLAAATVAGESGRSVVLLEGSPWLGGQIWRGAAESTAAPAARRWMARLRRSGVQVLCEATAFGASEARVVSAETPHGVRHFRWQQLILATGARELFLPFPGWTLPGVVGPGGLLSMVKGGWPVAGKRVVVAGSGPLLWAAADGLRQHGARVLCLVEQADFGPVFGFGLGLVRHPGKLAQAMSVKARLWKVPYRGGCWPVRVESAGEALRVTLVRHRRPKTVDYDLLAAGFHLIPNLEWPLLLGCALEGDRVRVDDFQETTVPGVFCAGEPTGIGGAERSLLEGQVAGLAVTGRRDQAAAWFGRRAAQHRFGQALGRAFALRPELRQLADPDTVVCRCEDVPHGRLASYPDARSAKLHTRCGMGPCQGRVCGGAARFLFGWSADTVRVPVLPVSVGSLAVLDEVLPTAQPPNAAKT